MYQTAQSKLASTLDHDERDASTFIEKLHTEALSLGERDLLMTALRRIKFASEMREHVSEAHRSTFLRYIQEIRGLIVSTLQNLKTELKATSVRQDELQRLLARLNTLVSLGNVYAPEAAAIAIQTFQASFIETRALDPPKLLYIKT